MALRSGAGGQPVPPLIESVRRAAASHGPPGPLAFRPKDWEGWPGRANFSPQPPPCPRLIKKKNLSRDFEPNGLSSGVRVHFGGVFQGEPPPSRGSLAPCGRGLVRALAAAWPRFSGKWVARLRGLGGTMAAAAGAPGVPALGKGLS